MTDDDAAVRTHFSKSRMEVEFPQWLLFNRYVLDEWESKLIMSPDHVAGEKVSSVDLRYWDNLHAVMGVISSNGIKLTEMDLSGNAGADSKCLAQASRLFGATLDSLILSNCPSIDETALAFLGGMSNLQSLDLSNVLHLQDYHVEKLLDFNLRQLKHLNVSGCIQLTNKSLECVARQRNRMKSLLAATNTNYTWHGVVDLLYNCEDIDVIDFSNCPNVKFFGCITRLSHHPEDRELKQFVSRSFKTLRLDGCVDIDEDSLDYICGALLELEEVSLAYIDKVSDPAVQALATGCPRLKKLHVQGCKAVKHEAVNILGSNIGACAATLLDLNIANVGHFRASAFSQLLRGCVNLKYLNASHNHGIVDSVFSELEHPPARPGAAPEPIFLPNMERLSLANTGLTSFGIACLAERCVNLNHLDISQHKHATNACLSVIAGCCRKLKSLWLNDCHALTDRGMLEIAYNCKLLEVLHLSSSVKYIDAWQSRFRQYTDVVAEAIFDGLRCLKELSMRNQCDIHLKSPWLLVEFSRRGGHQFLEKIDLRGVDELHLEGTAVVFQHCSELCYCILSPEEALPGVSKERFWKNAFAGCLYTAKHAGGAGAGAGNSHHAPDGGASAHGSRSPSASASVSTRAPVLGSALEGASVVTAGGHSNSAETSIFVPVTETQENTLFHSSIEQGRYSSDDGTASLISVETRKEIDEHILIQFRSRGDAAGGGSLAGTAATTRRRGTGASKSAAKSARGGRPGTSHSAASEYDDDGDASAAAAVGAVGGFGSESVSSLIEKVYSMTEFSTSKKQGLNRATTADGGKDAHDAKKKLVPAGYLALVGHPDRKKYRYRDFYIRRMLEEQACIRFIQFKYKLWAFWVRLRKKISARRISHTYKILLERRILAAKTAEMARINAARRIQRYFKFKKMPYVHASVKIQKIYRGYRCKGLLMKIAKGEWAAMQIQKIMRGVLVRISERFLIAQIYLKLPPFWRAICGYKNPDGIDEAVRKKLFLHQVSDAKDDTKKVVLKITQEVLREGILAPKLPVIIAQSFDKKPYASVNDGRKIALYSHSEGILWNDTGKTTRRMTEAKEKRMHRLKYDKDGNDLTKPRNQKDLKKEDMQRLEYLASLEDNEAEHASMHQYNIKFWPHTKPLHLTDTSTEQHDPMINNFDSVANERTVLFCEVCRTRLRIIHCDTCIRGYCFYCAFRTHTDPGRRNHTMKLIEPRVVHEAQVGKSLIYHLDMAQQASHDLKYLVKYMRSKGEVQRLKAEKQMAKEYEQQEEARRRAFLMAQGESNDRHAAATEISLLYRTKKARRIVDEKKKQNALEVVTIKEGKLSPVWIALQTQFRVWSTRKMMSDMGKSYVFRLDGKRKGKRKIGMEATDVPKEVRSQLRERIAYEANQRRIVERSVLMEKLIRAHSELVCILDANVEYWLHVDEHLPSEIEHAEEHKILVAAEHEAESQKTAKLKGELPPDEYEVFEQKLDSIWKKVECATLRYENFVNMRWWIAQHLRNAYRRRAAIKVRLHDSIARLKWNLVESGIIGRIEIQCDVRVKQFTPILGMGMATSWLTRYGDHPKVLQATLDAQQETILLEELSRLERDRHQSMEFDSLMEELYLGLAADNHLAAERVALDVAQLAGGLEQGSEEALRVASALVAIKMKQSQLNNNVLDTLKLGFQSKLNNEDDLMMTLYAFPEDDPDLQVQDFYKITAEILDPFSPPPHFKIDTFMKVYFVQPWLAEEAVKDVRLEEAIRKKNIEVGRVKEELKGVHTTISDNREKIITLRKNISELENEVDARSNIEEDDEETDEEKEERLALVATLSGELVKKSGELDVCIDVNEKVELTIIPLGKKIEEMELEIQQTEAQFQKRIDERERLKDLFFDTEIKENHELFTMAATTAATIEKQHVEIGRKHNALKLLLQEDVSALQDRLDNNRWTLGERDIFGIPLGSVLHKVQDLLAVKVPRTTCQFTHQLIVMTNVRKAFMMANLSVLEEMKEIIEKEEDNMNTFQTRIPQYQKAVELFIAKLVAARKQKSMQVEIELRKKRLADLREIRMRQLREAKEKLEEEAKQLEESKKVKAGKAVPLTKRVAKAVKDTIRGAKDFVEELRHSAETAMDQEEIRMQQNLRKNNKNADAKPEAIRKLHITHGNDETEMFNQQQIKLEDKGIPFYTKMERSFGSQFYLWYQNTMDNKLMITNIEFGSTAEGEASYKDPAQMKKDKWEAYGHHDLKMIMWVKRDPTKIKAFKAFEVSVSLGEENRNLIDGFEKFEDCMDKFGLPEMYLWYKKIDKIAVSTQLNSDEIIAEVEKTREMLKKNENDRNMQAHMDRLVDLLKKAYEREKSNIVTNPLKQIVDLLTLSPMELEVWMNIFGKIDKEQEGAINFDQIFEFFEETPTLFARHVFTSMDALDEFGTIEFGDFVRAVGTYCFFGKEQMLQFLFHYADKDKKGNITHAQFVTLLNSLNPFDKARAKRALQELQMIPDKEMKFPEFYRLNDEFPNIMHPAFRLQNAMRDRVLGVDWWFDKLTKYKGVRHKMTLSGGNVDKMAEREMERFKADEARQRRMKARDVEIRNEPSAIRKTLLQARQMVDEFS